MTAKKAKTRKKKVRSFGQVEPEIRPAGDIDAVVAAGERVPAIGEPPDALAERKRDHQEIDAAGADREQPEKRRRRRADQHAQQHHQPKIPAQADIVFGGEDRRQIGADAEIGRLAERSEAGKTEQKVDAHRQDGEDERAGGEQHHERGGQRNDNGERQENRGDGENFGCLAHRRPPSLAAEQAGRLDRQDQDHRRIEREIGELRKQRLAEIVGKPDQHRADGGAAK